MTLVDYGQIKVTNGQQGSRSNSTKLYTIPGAPCRAAVSYTHLDVYKRQRQNLRFAAAWERSMEEKYPGFTRPVLFSYRSVSYTHLYSFFW